MSTDEEALRAHYSQEHLGTNILKALELKAKLTGELKESPKPTKLKAL